MSESSPTATPVNVVQSIEAPATAEQPTKPGLTEQATEASKELLKKVKSRLSFWRGKTETEPQEVVEDIAQVDELPDEPPEAPESAPQAVETLIKTETSHELRPIRPGETFDGEMPILTGEDAARFNKKAIELYGQVAGEGKWSVVLQSEGKATKVFRQPDSILSAYEVVFMKRFGGKAGLPEFHGVVPNGYQMETIEGKTVASKIKEATQDMQPDEINTAMRGLLSAEQGQQLLNTIAEYHHATGRVHGDLATSKGWENMIITPEGTIRIFDTEWEKVGDQTPASEIQTIHQFLTENIGLEKLQLPKTISAEEAAENLANFKAEVQEMVEKDPVFRHVVRFKGQTTEVKTQQDGTILVNAPDFGNSN